MKRKDIEQASPSERNSKNIVIDPPGKKIKATNVQDKIKKRKSTKNVQLAVKEKEPSKPLSLKNIYERNVNLEDEIYNINIFIKFPTQIENYRVNLVECKDGKYNTNL